MLVGDNSHFKNEEIFYKWIIDNDIPHELKITKSGWKYIVCTDPEQDILEQAQELEIDCYLKIKYIDKTGVENWLSMAGLGTVKDQEDGLFYLLQAYDLFIEDILEYIWQFLLGYTPTDYRE